jgi:hypothetical protein
MAWTITSAGNKKHITYLTETYTLPGSATVGYSSVIRELSPDFSKLNRYVTFTFNVSAVSGTNVDIALYGSSDAAGTSKALLKDAVVADITATGEVAGVVDLNAYPAPYYFLGWTTDADEDANTIAVKVYG